MRTLARKLARLHIIGSAVVFTMALATAQTMVPSKSASNEEQEVIKLSPFEVSTDADTGYKASGTLAGTRLRTDLKDIAASISVVTKEFMQDIGANNLDDLLTYTVGTEVGGLGGNYSASGTDANFTTSFGAIRSTTGPNRVRGIGFADHTRDYFITGLPMDGYNTDRVEVNRGPNAMLFGLGGAAGIINSVLIKAQTNKTKTKVEAQYGQHETARITLDHNQVLVKDRLAVRVATLFGDKRYQQQPAYIRDKRIFLTATSRPWKGATIKASTESAKQFSNKVNVTPPADQFSYWFALGKPVYDPTTGLGTYIGTQPTDPNLQAFNANGTINGGRNLTVEWTRNPSLIMEDPNVTRFGVTGLDPQITSIEGANNRVRLNAAGTALAYDAMRYLNYSKNYLARLNQAASPELQNFWRDYKITDPSIFPFYDELLDGPNKREWVFWKTYNVTFEQRLGANAGVEVAWDRWSASIGYVNPLDSRDYSIKIDINTKLPNGFPNPNLGRPLASHLGFQGSGTTVREAYRATAYYNLDFVRGKDGWLRKALGKHVFTGVFTSQKRSSDSYQGRPYILGVDYWQSESANETISITGGVLWRQTYIGPSLLTATGPQNAGLQGVRVNNGIDGFPNATLLYYQTPAATPVAVAPWQKRTFSVIQSDQYDLSRTANFAATRTGDKTDSFVLLANSYWWNKTVVSTVGWRRDDYKTFNAGAAPIDPSTGLRYFNKSVWNYTAPTLAGSESTVSYGVVLHQPPFLRGKLPAGADVSLTYNKSDNFRPSGQRYDLFNNKLAPPSGKTNEYSALVSLFDHKVELRVIKYETKAALDTNTAFRNLQNELVRRLGSQIVLNSMEDYQAAVPSAALAAWNQWQQGPAAKVLFDTFQFTFTPGPTGTIVNFEDRTNVVVSTSSVVATGYEFDVTLNPTTQWRIAFNVAEQKTVKSDTAKSFRRMIELLGPVWGGTAAALPDSATSGNTLGKQWDTIVVNVQKEVLLDGSAVAEQRRWRYNIVSNYTFDRGSLKGWKIGGAFRWQDKAAIGYPVIFLPDGSGQYDVQRPFFGPTAQNVDGWIGYSRKLNEKIRWNVQVNVRNIGVGNRLIPVSAQPDGTYDSLRIADPQTWLLTTSFEF